VARAETMPQFVLLFWARIAKQELQEAD
jgi:hypothetical protein